MAVSAGLSTIVSEGTAGYLVGSGTGKVVILVHEIFGLNAHMRLVADRLANEGFTVFAIDLFEGRTTDELQEGLALSGALDWTHAARQIGKAAAALRAGGGAVAVVGFCLGGALALVAAASVAVDACVDFYGIPDPTKADLTRISTKVLGHFGTRDAYIANDRVDALESLLQRAGVPARLFRYDADHGFVREDPEGEAARLSWARTVTFLHEELGKR